MELTDDQREKWIELVEYYESSAKFNLTVCLAPFAIVLATLRGLAEIENFNFSLLLSLSAISLLFAGAVAYNAIWRARMLKTHHLTRKALGGFPPNFADVRRRYETSLAWYSTCYYPALYIGYLVMLAALASLVWSEHLPQINELWNRDG